MDKPNNQPFPNFSWIKQIQGILQKKVAASTEHSIKQSNVLENSIETEAVPK